MTLKLIISSVPEPVRAPPWNAEIMRWPAFAGFGVTDMPVLNVPACVNAGDAGVTIAGL